MLPYALDPQPVIAPMPAVSTRRLDLVATTGNTLDSSSESITLVLDAAWTPGQGEATRGQRSIRPFFAEVVERHDLYAEALAIVDGWAATTNADERLTVDGVGYWLRVRERMWHWTHERLLWRYTLRAVEAVGPFDAVSVPASERALIEVLQAQGRPVEVRDGTHDSTHDDLHARASHRPRVPAATGTPQPGPSSRRLVRLVRRAIGDRLRHLVEASSPAATERRRRSAIVEARFERLTRLGQPRILVLTLPGSYQRVGDAGDGARRDPNLGSVIPALRAAGVEPVVVGWGVDPQSDEHWGVVEADDRMIPANALVRRYARAEDRTRVEAAAEAIIAAIDGLEPVPLLLDGLDLGPAFVEVLRRDLSHIVRREVGELTRVERLVAELTPSALLLTQEHHRTPWLVAAARAGIPSFALQHGMLYPEHPGYPDRAHPAVVLPTMTFVFGDFDRRVLLACGYRPDEVAVSGSPRLDLDATSATARDAAAERVAVRRELGVADGDLLLVVSTVPASFIRRSHFVHMLERVLGGPLPGVHLVFKQHPGERDQGPYRDLLEGLARAGGYPPPPMTIVRDVDLYRLLRAADAHLGQQSTVLSDAVRAGTYNLIARVEAGRDILGYAAAGVARPVRDVLELTEALRDPRPAAAEARAAFLEDHFRPGRASDRIVEAVRASIADRLAAAAATAR